MCNFAPVDDIVEIGLRIRAAREAQGLGQLELSQLMGWKGQSRLSNYETGIRLPDPLTVRQLAQHLGTSPAHLMFGDSPAFQVDPVEREHLLMMRALPADVRDRIWADINWHFNVMNPDLASRANPFPKASRPNPAAKPAAEAG